MELGFTFWKNDECYAATKFSLYAYQIIRAMISLAILQGGKSVILCPATIGVRFSTGSSSRAKIAILWVPVPIFHQFGLAKLYRKVFECVYDYECSELHGCKAPLSKFRTYSLCSSRKSLKEFLRRKITAYLWHICLTYLINFANIWKSSHMFREVGERTKTGSTECCIMSKAWSVHSRRSQKISSLPFLSKLPYV